MAWEKRLRARFPDAGWTKASQIGARRPTEQLRSPSVPQILREAAETNDGGRFAHRSARTTQLRGHIRASREQVAPHWPRGAHEAVMASRLVEARTCREFPADCVPRGTGSADQGPGSSGLASTRCGDAYTACLRRDGLRSVVDALNGLGSWLCGGASQSFCEGAGLRAATFRPILLTTFRQTLVSESLDDLIRSRGRAPLP